MTHAFVATGDQLRALAQLSPPIDELALIQVDEHAREDRLRFAPCTVWITPFGGPSTRVEPDGSSSPG